MLWWANDHHDPCSGHESSAMRFKQRLDIGRSPGNWFLLFGLSLVLVVIANGTALDKRVSKHKLPQQTSIEERLEAKQRLSDLGYWIGPIDGNPDPAFRHALIAFRSSTTFPLRSNRYFAATPALLSLRPKGEIFLCAPAANRESPPMLQFRLTSFSTAFILNGLSHSLSKSFK